MRLTDGMKAALREVAFGVRKYKGAFYNIEDPTRRVDCRSLQALQRRGLICWDTRSGAPQYIYLSLTPEGEQVFEEIESR